MKMTINEFIEEYERMCKITEFDPPDEKLGMDSLLELHKMVAEMFNDNCGQIPNFELSTDGRKIILLTGGVSYEEN
jgi:hypothetical protein